MNLSRLLQTVRYLRPVQVTNRIARRLPVHPRQVSPDVRPRVRPFVAFPDFKPAPLKNPGRLRDYTLHYHHSIDTAGAAHWVRSIAPGARPAWDAYPLSLRIVNWIKRLDRPDLSSLACQADYLHRTVEYHLQANHLFVNAKALVFAGTFFQEDRWLNHGLRILSNEIPEQILFDGGHYERTPMYHSLILEDLLDLVNLAQAYPGLLPDWKPFVGPMLGWLEHMTHPDGGIAFFNDAAFGVAPPLSELRAYAARLGIQPASLPLGESGYIRLERGSAVLIFDAAPLGPDYQPGHAHADTLSFELSCSGRRVIVNSGTSTYERSPERVRQRGTAAHSTLRIDGLNSSDVWASHRVGRRARPFDISVSAGSAEAAHDGYRPIIHRRRIDLRESEVAITDSIEGSGTHLVEIFFHLAPGADPSCVQLDPAFTLSVEPSTYHPQFDASVPNQVVIGGITAPLPAKFSSRISL